METESDPERSETSTRTVDAHLGSSSFICVQAAYRRRYRTAFAVFRERVCGPLIGHVSPTAPPA